MWTEITKSGKTRFVERFNDPITGKERKTSITVDKVTKAIEKQMPFLLQEKIDNLIAESIASETEQQKTFDDISVDWLEYYRPNVKQSSYYVTKNLVGILNDYFGDIVFDEITHADINQYFYNRMKDDNLKYNTATQMLSVIKRIVKYAFKFQNIDKTDILDYLEINKMNMTKRNDLKYLTDEELQLVIKSLNDLQQKEVARMVQIQVSIGCRFNEMMAIRIEDINFEDNSILISRNYDRINKIFSTPKTGNARVVYFSDDLKPILKAQINVSNLKHLKFKIKRDNQLLFIESDGLPFDVTKINHRLAKLDVPGKKVTTHIFRHTFITKAVEAGISKSDIIYQVGHVDASMIDTVYLHFTDKMAEKQKEAMLGFKII